MSGPVVFILRLLLTVSLYAFLVWAFTNLWRDIKLQSALLAARKIPPISLTICLAGQVAQIRRFIQAEVFDLLLDDIRIIPIDTIRPVSWGNIL